MLRVKLKTHTQSVSGTVVPASVTVPRTRRPGPRATVSYLVPVPPRPPAVIMIPWRHWHCHATGRPSHLRCQCQRGESLAPPAALTGNATFTVTVQVTVTACLLPHLQTKSFQYCVQNCTIYVYIGTITQYIQYVQYVQYFHTIPIILFGQ